jgi:hypothetical protein
MVHDALTDSGLQWVWEYELSHWIATAHEARLEPSLHRHLPQQHFEHVGMEFGYGLTLVPVQAMQLEPGLGLGPGEESARLVHEMSVMQQAQAQLDGAQAWAHLGSTLIR